MVSFTHSEISTHILREYFCFDICTCPCSPHPIRTQRGYFYLPIEYSGLSQSVPPVLISLLRCLFHSLRPSDMIFLSFASSNWGIFQGLHLVGFISRFHSLNSPQRRGDQHAGYSLMRTLGINSLGKDGEGGGMGRDTTEL